MDCAWFLNTGGLVLTTIAAWLMYYFPPRVVQYSDSGAEEVLWVKAPTVVGKSKGSMQRRMSKLAPALLVVGFFLQLLAALLSGFAAHVG